MKVKVHVKGIVFMVIAILSLNAVGFSERVLDQSEILLILQTLTDQPQDGWISSGTVEAVHQSYHEAKITDPYELNQLIEQSQQDYLDNPSKRERNTDIQQMHYEAIPFNIRYKHANKYQMTTRETVKYDGSRFNWKIDVLSREDSVKVPQNSTFMHDYFNLDWNGKRVFNWDGEKYTRYFRPSNHASVDENPSNIPIRVNGPLTAGCIPWGNGIYELSRLEDAELSGVEIIDGTQTEIHINAVYSPALAVSFVLDADKDFAPLHCTISKPGQLTIIQSYDDYQLVSGQRVPFTIVIEKYKGDMDQLISRDTWNITAIDNTPLGSEDFEVAYETDALIEYRASFLPQSHKYRHADPAQPENIDVASLLSERLSVASGAVAQPVNCATLAMKYTASQLGKQTDDQQLAQLINSENQTSLFSLTQYSQNLGLYAIAVKTDINILKSLQNCQVILHLPSNNHFVALGNIDDEYIRLIDLSRDNFFYRSPLTKFQQDWQDGTALILSNEPIALSGTVDTINTVDQQYILGAGCPFGCYSCTDLLQNYSVTFCDLPSGGICDSTYIIYEERWGCEASASGSCYSSTMARRNEISCAIDPSDPGICITDGNWTTYYMRACN